jgi:hypothetical protein
VGREEPADLLDGIARIPELPAEDAARPRAQEAEARAPLPALDRLEQEGVALAARDLQERGDRRLGVGIDLDADRDGAAGLAEL